jgi:hypothetical protein
MHCLLGGNLRRTHLRRRTWHPDEAPVSAAQGDPARCGQIGIEKKSLDRYRAVCDLVTRSLLNKSFSHGAGATERFREDLKTKTGRSFDRSLAIKSGAIRERKQLLPLSLFEIYLKHNEIKLTDAKVADLVSKLVDISDLLTREERENDLYEKLDVHRRKQGLTKLRRNEHLNKLKKRLVRILQDGDEDARGRFQKLWLGEVLQLEYTTLSRLGEVDPGPGSIADCQRMLKLFSKLTDGVSIRGPKKRIARRQIIDLVLKHYKLLTGATFRWSGSRKEPSSAESLIADVIRVLGSKNARLTEQDLRDERSRRK